MVKRSKVDLMPDAVRAWLDKALIDSKFSGYKELEELVKAKGFDISHAAIHRHGQKLERRLSAIQASTRAAEAIAKAAPDSADNRSSAVTAMIQTALFDALMDLQDAESMDVDDRIATISKAAQGFAKLSASSVNLKKYQAETEAKLAGLENQAKKGKVTIDADTLELIKKTLYG